MRTETTTREIEVFDELTEEAQQSATEGLSDINTRYEWWDRMYAVVIACLEEVNAEKGLRPNKEEK